MFSGKSRLPAIPKVNFKFNFYLAVGLLDFPDLLQDRLNIRKVIHANNYFHSASFFHCNHPFLVPHTCLI